MELTDKIINTELFNKQIECYCDDTYHAQGMEDCLKKITPKVAIDFGKFLIVNRFMLWPTGYMRSYSDDRVFRPTIYTEEEAFQEFLKDYKYGN
jgi:hypothetical protein